MRLYEALLWEPPLGFFLLEEHLERLARSAARFDFSLRVDALRGRLSEFAAGLPPAPRKVRLEVSARGGILLEDRELRPSSPVRAALARVPVQSDEELLRHKTSERAVYDHALASHPGADDVLLWNERGELTESCSANLVLELDGRRLTPPLSSGLLPGTFRAHLLARGEIEEAVVPVAALERADAVHLVNSVRRWVEVRLLQATG